MKYGEFTADDIVEYLNQELPGFEPQLIRDSDTRMTTLRVRTRIAFGSYADIANETLYLPINEQSYHLKREIEAYVRKTREQAIDKLGLQKQIDAEVQRKLSLERGRIEQEAYKKAMNDALDRVSKSAEEERNRLAAGLWNTFMGRTTPTPDETNDDFLDED